MVKRDEMCGGVVMCVVKVSGGLYEVWNEFVILGGDGGVVV